MKPVAIEEPLRIERLGELGEGLANWQGLRVAIPYTLPGELIRVDYAGREKDQIFARIGELIEPSPQRVAPPCRHFGKCGGCGLQHLPEGEYRAWKQGILASALSHYSVEPERWLPMAASPPRSRRRAVFSARHTANGLRLGFNEKKANWIVDLAECPISLPEIERFLRDFHSVLEEILGPGEKLDIFVNALDHGLDVLLQGELEPTLQRCERLGEFAQRFGVARLGLRSRKYKTTPIAELKAPTCRFGKCHVAIPPGAFLQATLQGEAAMIALVTQALADHAEAGKAVADLFSGCGTLGLPQLERHAVHAYESDRKAVESVKGVAHYLPPGSRRLEVFERNLFDAPLRAAELASYGAVILDPPRAGAAAQARELAASQVPVVIYISCGAQSFARDARALIDGGYRLKSVMPIDQFLWSHHLEMGGVFLR